GLRRDPGLVDSSDRIGLPLIPVLARMEERGIRIDVPLLRAMSNTMGAQLAELETQIYAEAGTEFNINSPQQLAHILFEKLQYPVIKKTKGTKAYSTSVDVLQDALTHDQRRAAKTINFGVLYGMSAFRLSNELNISGAQAKDWIEAYFNRYPKIQEYLDRTLEEARRTGKVTTLFGRVRYIP